jgi:hypothetical protein
MDVATVLYYLVAFDALLVLGSGIFAAGMYLVGTKLEMFWSRVVPAVGVLVGTSLAAGAILWIAEHLFG